VAWVAEPVRLFLRFPPLLPATLAIDTASFFSFLHARPGLSQFFADFSIAARMRHVEQLWFSAQRVSSSVGTARDKDSAAPPALRFSITRPLLLRLEYVPPAPSVERFFWTSYPPPSGSQPLLELQRSAYSFVFRYPTTPLRIAWNVRLFSFRPQESMKKALFSPNALPFYPDLRSWGRSFFFF